MYLTYDEFVELGGTFDDATFNYLEYEAESYINWYTFNRLKGETNIPEEVKNCIFHMIVILKNKLDSLSISPDGSGSTSTVNAGITSQSNDGVSVSYNVLSAGEMIESSKKELEDALQRDLQGVRNSIGHRLLFRGLYPDEVVK